MSWWQSIVLGLIQGLTEFLPVSSSGHLVIAQEIFGIHPEESILFDVVVHAATVMATLVAFRKQLREMLTGLFKFKYNDETDYFLKLCVSMIPVLIVGLFLKDQVQEIFSNLLLVGLMLILTALLLFCSDRASAVSKEFKSVSRNGISYLQAFMVGIGQALAVAPGLSRSGTTISTGLLCGVRREVMGQFSFLMVLVPILGDLFLEVVGGELAQTSVGVLPMVLGFVSAFVSGMFACKAMVALVKRAKLKWFGLYCALVGLAVVGYCVACIVAFG